MEYPVIHHGETIGVCSLEQRGLYWHLSCHCSGETQKIERLYSGSRSVGVLEPIAGQLVLTRRLPRSSWPELPPEQGSFSLEPEGRAVPWEGEIAGCPLKGERVGTMLRFPYDPHRPCPCEPLFCFFEIRDGFWLLPIKIVERIV